MEAGRTGVRAVREVGLESSSRLMVLAVGTALDFESARTRVWVGRSPSFWEWAASGARVRMAAANESVRV